MIPHSQNTRSVNTHDFSQLCTALFYTVGSVIARVCKVSFILGSKAAFFSLNQALVPSVGFFAQPAITLGIYLVRACCALLFLGISPLSALVYHVPSFCAALYLSSAGKSFKILLPLVCMITFVMHPVGSQAWVYALYWLIPITIALVSARNIYLQALGSTFTAHAVGSVLWLFTHNLTAQQWQALTGIVWAERLLFAGCITVCYYGIRYAQKYLQRVYKYYKIQQLEQDAACSI